MKEIIREEKTTIIQFVGSVGGLLGLFMGLSFISVIEILYMLLDLLFNKLKKWLNITKAVQVESQTTDNASRLRSQSNNTTVSSFLESIMDIETKRY